MCDGAGLELLHYCVVRARLGKLILLSVLCWNTEVGTFILLIVLFGDAGLDTFTL